MKMHISAEVLCPFYCQEDDFRICCEGVTKKSRVHNVFGGSSQKQAYERDVCCMAYKRCLIYKMLMSKYEETKDE